MAKTMSRLWRRLSATERAAILGGIFAVAAAVVGALLYTLIQENDSPRIAAKDDIILHVSAFTLHRELKRERIRYVVVDRAQGVLIGPDGAYIDAMRGKGEIGGAPPDPLTHREEPTIDVKVVNNGPVTVFITEAILRVERSRIDPWPFLSVTGFEYDGLVRIHNDGWGEVRDCSVSYNVIPPSEPRGEARPFREVIGTFEQGHTFSVMGALKSQGIDPLVMKRFTVDWMVTPSLEEFRQVEKELLGPYSSGWATVYGSIDFKGQTALGEWKNESLRFATDTSVRMYVGLRLPGAPALVSQDYGAILQVDANDYEVRVPLSQAVRPGEFDRFLVRLRVEKSSHHRFRIALIYNNDREIVSRPIDLEALVTRAHYMALREERRESHLKY